MREKQEEFPALFTILYSVEILFTTVDFSVDIVLFIQK